MKIKVQAQHLKAGDIVGNGEKVTDIVRASIHFPSSKVYVMLNKNEDNRGVLWGKHTMINVERADAKASYAHQSLLLAGKLASYSRSNSANDC